MAVVAGPTSWWLNLYRDSYFSNVSLLLHGDGTNGAQNNTFVDGSTNNFTITRNGNTTQGTFSPFSPSGWSGYFDGTGDYLSWSGTTLSGDFTVECWVYKTATDASGYTNVFSSSSQNTQLAFDNTTAGSIVLVISSSIVIGVSGTAVTPNTWHHLAWVREGSTCRAYVNGVQQGTGTSSASMNLSFIGQFQSGGYEMNGYISNARITNACLYPGGTTFTPSTSPLTTTVSSGTVQLLTLQDNRFKDNSTNNFAITSNGDTKIEAFSPFNPTAAYSASTHGGSGYFDGSGDYLYINSSSDFDLESGAYTLEFWVWFNSRVPGTRTVVLEGSTKTVGIIATGTGNNDLYVNEFGTANVIVATGVLAGKDNQWLHIAVSSDGTTRRLFLDGSVVASTTNSLFDSGNNSVGVGGNIVRYSGANLNGYISNLRVVKGTALYTSNFTPPTAPLTAITNTSLLLNFTNGGIIDNASKNVLETVGNAQISTSVKKFGTGSLAFDGSGDYLKFGSSPYTGFGTGDFTIEAWVYLTSSTVQNNGICDCRYSASATGPLLYYIPTTGLLMFYNGDNRIIGGTISINTWTHVALARSSGSTKLYIDGTQVGSTYSDSNNYSSGVNNAVVGAFYDGSGSWNGYIDDLRITRGVARYTANFTPPTEAFFDR